MTHLVLHKVRGEAAFDVAEQIAIGDDVGWIIPTSGHRCYPYQTWPLVQLVIGPLPDVPKGHPDHYVCNDTSLPEKEFDLGNLLSRLVPKVKRRI
jgi:hypothetical protein